MGGAFVETTARCLYIDCRCTPYVISCESSRDGREIGLLKPQIWLSYMLQLGITGTRKKKNPERWRTQGKSLSQATRDQNMLEKLQIPVHLLFPEALCS